MAREVDKTGGLGLSAVHRENALCDATTWQGDLADRADLGAGPRRPLPWPGGWEARRRNPMPSQSDDVRVTQPGRITWPALCAVSALTHVALPAQALA